MGRRCQAKTFPVIVLRVLAKRHSLNSRTGSKLRYWYKQSEQLSTLSCRLKQAEVEQSLACEGGIVKNTYTCKPCQATRPRSAKIVPSPHPPRSVSKTPIPPCPSKQGPGSLKRRAGHTVPTGQLDCPAEPTLVKRAPCQSRRPRPECKPVPYPAAKKRVRTCLGGDKAIKFEASLFEANCCVCDCSSPCSRSPASLDSLTRWTAVCSYCGRTRHCALVPSPFRPLLLSPTLQLPLSRATR